MKKLFILLSLVLIPSLLFAWTEPTGSTFTAVTGEMEIKDIVNDVYDKDESALSVIMSTDSLVLSLQEPVTSYITTSQFLELTKHATNFLTLSQMNELTKWSTYFMTISQYDELRGHTTTYMTVSQFNKFVAEFDELREHATNYLNINQFDELTEHTTNFMNISQYDELKGHSTYYLTVSQYNQIITELEEIQAHTTNYITASQFDELRSHTTGYLTVSQLDELTKFSTSYLTVSQFNSIVNALAEISGHSTNYLTISQFDELRKNTTSWISNSDFPDSTAQGSLSSIDTAIEKIVQVIGSSLPVVNLPYMNMNSSGTAGIITGATSGTITIAEKVYNYCFLYKSSDTTHAVNIKNSINRNGIYLFNYDENERAVPIPVALTFTITDLLLGDTVQYDIGTLQP